MAVGVFPRLHAFGFAHLVTLVQVHVAGVAQGGDTVVVSLDAAAFAVTELIGMGCHHSPIPSATLLAWRLTHYLQ